MRARGSHVADLRFPQTLVGRLSIGTDAWTSPKKRALVAFTVTFADDGKIKNFLLDVVEVAKVRRVLNCIMDRH